MVPSDSQSERRCRRRRFVTRLGQTAAVLGGVGSIGSASAAVSRQMVIPTVTEFSDNYAGQFLTIREQDVTDADVSLGGCQDVGWPDDEVIKMQGQLTDRRSDVPLAVQLPVYLDARKPSLAADTMFIVDTANECDDGNHVFLDTSSVSIRNVAGPDPGPTVGEDVDVEHSTPGDNGPGFGLLAGVAGGAGALLLRALRRRE